MGTAVLGGGPAGLTSAWMLARAGEPATVFEADGTVGGIAKTVEFDGYRFDLGGHRFYTKLEPVAAALGGDARLRASDPPAAVADLLPRPLLQLPAAGADVFRGLGVVESAMSACSYLYWRRKLRRVRPATFEDWVVSRFGRRLYDAFFRSYTEKVWGIPGSEIQAEWAAQRIQEFSFSHAIFNILGMKRGAPPTLIEEFLYPRLGPGQMWEAFADAVADRGIPVRLNHRCIAINHSAARADASSCRRTATPASTRSTRCFPACRSGS